jgi:3-phenylpropionate/trans-cinnamate dioxygenase ferredoxin subunit
MMRYRPVALLENVPAGIATEFAMEGRSIVLCRSGEEIFAVENRCSHNASPLAGGRVRGGFLFCPVHGARFDLRDGSTSGALTKTALATFPVVLEGGQIAVGFDDAE